MMKQNRVGAVSAIGGGVLLLLGTYLHPMKADPNNAVAAFSEYAGDRLWIASHLVQLTGFTLMVAALLCLALQLEATRGASWSRLAAGGAVASLAVATALQGVDGIALKAMVDAWAVAQAAQKDAAFYAAFAVRQVEIGLASTLGMLSGATVVAYGLALWRERTYPVWTAVLALIAGVATLLAGGVTAYSGFSPFAMALSMPASALLVFWLFVIGVSMWRQPRRIT